MTASASPRRSAGSSSGHGAHLDVAGGGQLQADGARHVDVEAGEDIVLVEVVEGRIVAVGEEADGDAPRQRLASLGLGAAGVRLRLLLLREARRRRGRAQQRGQQKVRQLRCASSVTCSFVFGLFARRAAWPWGTRGGGLPAAAVARDDSRPHTSADAARRTAGGRRAACPAPHCVASEYAFLVGRSDRRGHAGRGRGGSAAPAAWRPTRCCWRRAWSRRTTMPRPWPAQLGVPLVGWDDRARGLAAVPGTRASRDEPAGDGATGGRCRVLAATEAPPESLLAPGCRAARARHRGRPGVPAFASMRRCESARQPRADRPGRARPAEAQPASSAARPPRPGRRWRPPSRSGSLIGGFAVLPDATFAALTALIALPFLCVTLLRAGGPAAGAGRARQRARAASGRRPPRAAPTSSCRSTPCWCRCCARPTCCRGWCSRCARSTIPRPSSRSSWCSRPSTPRRRRRCSALDLPGNFRTLVVPDRQPRTKPKALNYALQFARGEFVVVYDAEDRPQPDQLRRAWEVFRRARRSSAACRPSSTSTIRARAGSPASSRSNIPCCSMPSCRRWSGCGCRCRWAARRTISPRHARSRSAPGTRSTSPRTPTSASAWRGRATARACWPRRRGRRRRRASASGSSSARAGSRAGCRPISCTPATSAGSTAIWAGARRSAFTC